MVGEFRLAQAVESEILLAVDERIVFRQVLREELVDHREGPVVMRVGLFDVHAEGVVVDGRTEGERRKRIPHEKRSALQFQLLEMVERPLHGALFGRQLRTVSFVLGPPFAFEPHAFGNQRRSERFVPILVHRLEAVDMVPFGLVFPSGKVPQVGGIVNIILVVAVAPDAEFRMGLSHRIGALPRESRKPQRLPELPGIGFEPRNEVCEIARPERLHVADVTAAVDVEADEQESLLDTPCTAVGTFPAIHVGEGQVTVADA